MMRVHQAVIKPVLILLVVILVHALMAMSLMLMVIIVMVRYSTHEIVTTSTDINECIEDIDGCQVHCSNTIGSYNCYCDNGYELLNSTHCTGTLYSMMECKRLHTCL